jgi:hypothetical protein
VNSQAGIVPLVATTVKVTFSVRFPVGKFNVKPFPEFDP